MKENEYICLGYSLLGEKKNVNKKPDFEESSPFFFNSNINDWILGTTDNQPHEYGGVHLWPFSLLVLFPFLGWCLSFLSKWWQLLKMFFQGKVSAKPQSYVSSCLMDDPWVAQRWRVQTEPWPVFNLHLAASAPCPGWHHLHPSRCYNPTCQMLPRFYALLATARISTLCFKHLNTLKCVSVTTLRIL